MFHTLKRNISILTLQNNFQHMVLEEAHGHLHLTYFFELGYIRYKSYDYDIKFWLKYLFGPHFRSVCCG